MPNNPIIKLKTKAADYYKPPTGGGRRKFFEENYSENHVIKLASSIGKVQAEYKEQFEKHPLIPGVFKVNLIKDALAKSHRPDGLFALAECSVIGVDRPGELLVSAPSFALELLASEIVNNDTAVGKANISTIESISPITTKDKIGKSRHLQDILKTEKFFKLRIFNYRDQTDNENALVTLHALFQEYGITKFNACNYSPGTVIYSIEVKNENQLQNLGSFLAAQSLDIFPTYKPVRSTKIITGALEDTDISAPDANEDYPVVGVFDSGIDPRNRRLKPWVVKSTNYIPMPDPSHNFDHGTFVSGLVVSPKSLNRNDPRFPDCRAKVLDVAGLHADGITELDLISRLEEAIQDNPDVKVWNLSLSTEELRSEGRFSDLAVFLDRMQVENQISIVLSSGNYEMEPFRGWPNDIATDADLLTVPGESALSVTVGAVAHTDAHDSRVRKEQPSPFSRKGPGTGLLAKPDIVHYGGNCTSSGSYLQIGILSTVEDDKKAENIGTSFSTPIVSSILANMRQKLGRWDNRITSKALLIHSAVLNSNSPVASDLKFRGFGIPLDVAKVLETEDYSATVIYEFELVEGINFVKELAIPSCLITASGKTTGKFSLTVVYDPPLDASSGSEYCRCNIEVSLGAATTTENGNISVKSLVPPTPTNMRSLFEASLVENGFKWSPVKVHQKEFPRGVEATNWAFRAALTSRKQFSTTQAVKAVAILTIEDPGKKLPVYADFLKATASLNLEFDKIEQVLRNRLRSKS